MYKPLTFLSLSMLLLWQPLCAQQKLDLASCRAWAIAHSPLQDQVDLLRKTQQLSVELIQQSNLPQISFAGQASYQSDVFTLPFELPTVSMPEIPRFQFNLSLDIKQKIYDGGQAQHAQNMLAWDERIQHQQTQVELYQLHELINGLYFNVLLLEKQRELLHSQSTQLSERLETVEAAITHGVLLEGDAAAFKIRILQLEQELAKVVSSRSTLIELLEIWTGKEDLAGYEFNVPRRSLPLSSSIVRPEHQLFATQLGKLDAEIEARKLSLRPTVGAFGRLGLGSPNPFNFFETSLSPFYIVGINFVWQPFDWKSNQKKNQLLELQEQIIYVRQRHFDRGISVEVKRVIDNAVSYEKLLTQDSTIIALQENILKQADAQLTNGVITSNDYLEASNKLTQLNLQQELHRLKVLEAKVRAETLAGN